MVRVGLVQLAVDERESISGRIDRALEVTEETAGSADVVILPEVWPTGAFNVNLGLQNAQQINSPLIGQLAEIAERTSTWLHGGSFVEVDAAGRFFNTSVLFAPNGSLAGVYRKIHLFGFDAEEAALLSAGTDLVTVDTPLGLTGLATCYDLRFPEMFRALMDRGATAFLVASGWPAARIRHWNILAQARAIENQAWFVGCNAAGYHAGTELGGRSIVVDPWGDPVAEAGQKDEVLFADINPLRPDAIRQSFPVLKDRKAF